MVSVIERKGRVDVHARCREIDVCAVIAETCDVVVASATETPRFAVCVVQCGDGDRLIVCGRYETRSIYRIVTRCHQVRHTGRDRRADRGMERISVVMAAVSIVASRATQ